MRRWLPAAARASGRLATLTILVIVFVGAATARAEGLSPAVVTGPTTGITEKEATVHGTVNPEGAETKYYFEYGTTESYGSKTAEASAGSGTSNVEVSKAITGLASNTKYHYRIVASNSNGSATDGDRTFTTTHWSLREPPLPVESPTNSTLRSVSCTSSTECVAVGSVSTVWDKPLVEKWNGSSWSAQELSIPTGAKSGRLLGVSCASSTSCLAVGYFLNGSGKVLALAEKWDGTAWTAQELPSPTGAKEPTGWDVSCTSSTACIAVGSFVNGGEHPLADRWNGTEWSVQEPPSPTGAKDAGLEGVSCTSSTECIAVGEFEKTAEKPLSLAEKWNGTAWTAQEPPSPTGAKMTGLEGVSCTSSTACTAVGYFYNSSEKRLPLAEAWNGTSWSAQEPPAPTGVQFYLRGISCTSATACIAVGEWYEGFAKERPLAEIWNGTTWTIQEPPTPAETEQSELWGVSCTTFSECVAVGDFVKGINKPLAEHYT